jgi:hypothetical protein
VNHPGRIVEVVLSPNHWVITASMPNLAHFARPIGRRRDIAPMRVRQDQRAQVRDERLGDFYGARDKVSVKGLKVPADSRRSFDLAIARIGSTTMLNSAGRRPLNRASIASPTAVSVMTGRRGPCCPIAATGRIRSSFRDRAPENRLLSQFAKKKRASPTQSSPLTGRKRRAHANQAGSFASSAGIAFRGDRNVLFQETGLCSMWTSR